MTTNQIYQLKRSCYAQHSQRWQTIRATAYPETGGVSLFIHNWYACSNLPDAALASIIANSGEWSAWHRIEARIDRWYDAADHRSHTGKFSPLWCAACQEETTEHD